MAPSYLAGSLHLTSESDTRRRLRSADTVVLSTDHSTVGDRVFPVASARAWNGLPPSVRVTDVVLPQPEDCTVPVIL